MSARRVHEAEDDEEVGGDEAEPKARASSRARTAQCEPEPEFDFGGFTFRFPECRRRPSWF